MFDKDSQRRYNCEQAYTRVYPFVGGDPGPSVLQTIYEMTYKFTAEENMKRYGNRHGNSGIAAYEEGSDFISLRFTI